MKNQPVQNDLEFDELLNLAAASYTPAEPRPGFELRIMNSLAASRDCEALHVSQANIRPWTVAEASFAAAWFAVTLAIAIGIWTHVHRAASSAQSANNALQAQALPVQITPQGSRAKAEAAPSRLSFKRVRKSASTTPAAVGETKALKPTEQEFLLRQLIAKGASKALALPSSQKDPLTAVTVAPLEDNPIEIQPLTSQPISIAPIRVAALQPLSNPAE